MPSQTFMHMQPSLPHTEFPGLSAIRRTASAGGYSQILSHIPTIQTSSTSEDGERSSDNINGPLGINFAAQLKQFEHMQHQHHLYQSQNKAPRRTLTPPPAQVYCTPKFVLKWTLVALFCIRVASSFHLRIYFCLRVCRS